MAGLVMIQNAYPPTIPGSGLFSHVGVNEIIKVDNISINNVITANTISDGTATLSGGVLSGLLTPVSGSDAANKAYVDTNGGSQTWKDPARVASLSNIPTISGLLTIDGITVVAGDIVLLKDQSNGIENGIYEAAVGTWSRAPGLETGSSASGIALLIQEGTVNGTNLFTCTTIPGSDTVGTDSLTIVKLSVSPAGSDTQIQFNNSGTFGASSGLVWSGTSLTTSGILNVTNTTTSSNTSTGSAVFSGGVGVANSLFCGGNVSAVEFVTTSDATLKYDVEPIRQPLELLDLIDPVQYKLNFVDDKRVHYGVLAQDLQEQGLSDLVVNSGTHLSVNYNDLIGILLGSVQELRREVNNLKNLKI
jgi:hypothetical protein